jgi:hypothetical protein
LHDIEERAHAEIAIRNEQDLPFATLEIDCRLRVLEVVPLLNLLLRLVDRVIDFLEINSSRDVE